jgi:Uri superfamily endonuclease
MRGIYLLHIIVERDQEIAVGALGRVAFPAGAYVYVGSAQGGLEKRTARHRRTRKKRRWHIDYLLSARGVSLRDVVYAEAGREKECEVARLLAATARPVRGFGSSDCGCVSHLFAPAGRALIVPPLDGLHWQRQLAPGDAPA